MLDISHELVNKLTLNIIRHPDSDSKIGVAELVKGIIYDRLTELYNLSADWRAFAGGAESSQLPTKLSKAIRFF